MCHHVRHVGVGLKLGFHIVAPTRRRWMRGRSGNRTKTGWLITPGETRSVTSCWGGNKFLLWCRISSEIELYSVFQCFLFVTRNLTGSFTRFSGLAKLHTSCIKFACFRFFSNLEVTMTYFNERVPSEKNTLDLNGDVHLAHQSPFQNRQRPSLSLPNPLSSRRLRRLPSFWSPRILIGAILVGPKSATATIVATDPNIWVIKLKSYTVLSIRMCQT